MKSFIAIHLKDKDLNRTINTVKGSIRTNSEYPYLYIYITDCKNIGLQLLNNYKKYEDVLEFILKGDRATFDQPYFECGESWSDNKPDFVKTVKGKIPECVFYLFENNKWYYRDSKFDCGYYKELKY